MLHPHLSKPASIPLPCDIAAHITAKNFRGCFDLGRACCRLESQRSPNVIAPYTGLDGGGGIVALPLHQLSPRQFCA
jgi:hypothetical protein